MKRLPLTLQAVVCFLLCLAAPFKVTGQTETHNIRRFNFASNDIIYDAASRKLYASVPSSAGPIGNSITVIDPAAGSIGLSAFIGSEPNKLALSDNGQYLYAGLDGAAAVRRFDLAGFSPGLQFNLGETSGWGVLYAKDIAVLPGSPESVAVTYKEPAYGQPVGGVAIYDNGVQRPQTTALTTEWIEFPASSSSIFYGLWGTELRRMAVDATGLSVLTRADVFASGDIRLDNGRLYTTTGKAINPETGALLGSFSVNNSVGLVAPDSTVGRVYFLTIDDLDSARATLQAFDINTFASIGSVSISGISGKPLSLVRWGVNGLAFNTSGKQLFLIQTTLVPSAEPVPTATPTPIATPTPTSTPPPGDVRAVSLATNDIIYDAASRKLYASVPSSAGPIGNSITVIDPAAGSIGLSAFIGSEPNKLALSDNGQYLYAGLDGAAAVRRFDLAGFSPGLQFTLKPDLFDDDPMVEPLTAEDIKVMPGSPGTIAVSMKRSASPRHAGVAIYDNDVQRPMLTRDHTGSNRIEFSSSPSVLYGLNTETTEYGFRKMAVVPCGVITHNVTENASSGSREMKHSNGRVYLSYGRVIDPETGVPLGTFVLPEAVNIQSISVLPDSAVGRVYFLRYATYADGVTAVELYAFDQTTFLLLGAVRVPGVSGVPSTLIKAGADDVAFRTETGQVMLVKTTGFAAATTIPAPAPAPPTPTFSLTGTVAGFDGRAIEGVNISVSGAEIAETLTDANGTFKVENLSGCGTYAVTPTKANYYFSLSTEQVTFKRRSIKGGQAQPLSFTGAMKTLQFNSATFTAYEALSSLRINVTRTGNIAEPATVDYTTSDSSPLVNCATVNGLASGRCDYTMTFDTLRFNEGEMTKEIIIPLTDDAHQEGAETFNVTLSNATGAFLGTDRNATITITDNDDAATASNPIDSTPFFVRMHYLDFLSREPEADGLNAWTGVLNNCSDVNNNAACDRLTVSASFFGSEEFQVKGFFVYRYYRASLGRMPTYVEMVNDMVRVTGKTAEERIAKQNAFVDAWLYREAHVPIYPSTLSNDEFVTKLEQTAEVTLANKAQLVAELNSFAKTRAQVLRSVVESQEVIAKYRNEAFVAMQYFGYLRRDPETDGFNAWLRVINANPSDARTMVNGFVNSVEYRSRFGRP